MRLEPRKVCKPCVFFNGSDCEFRFERTINVDPVTGVESCITKIDRYKDSWHCCGGMALTREEKCSICGEKYEE